MTSDADTQPGSDSLFPTGFSGGGALVRPGSVGTGEIADGSIAAADLNLASVTAALNGTYASVVGLAGTGIDITGATDSAAAINSLLAASAGKVVRGVPGATYLISAPLVVRSGTTLDMTGCTVALAAGANCNLLNNRAVSTTVRAVSDAAITSGAATLTSATAAFTSADIGRSVTVAGALGTGPLCAIITAVGSSTSVTLSAPATTTVSAAAATLYDRDRDITIVGGTWARGSNAGTATDLHCLRFRRVDGIAVRGLKVTSSGGKYAVNFGDVTRYVAEDLTFAANSDGVHVSGPAFSGRVSNLRGTTGDDMMAFTAADYTTYLDVQGDITGCIVTGIFPEGSLAALKVISGTGTRIKGVTVRGIHGTTQNRPVAIIDDLTGPTDVEGIRVSDVTCMPTNANQSLAIIYPTAGRDIILDGFHWDGPIASTNAAMVDVYNAASLASLTVRDFFMHGAQDSVDIVRVRNTATLKDLVIDGVYAYDLPTNSQVASVATGTTVDHVHIKRVDYRYGSGTTGSLAAGSGYIKRLSLSEIYTNAGNGVRMTYSNASNRIYVRLRDVFLDGGGSGGYAVQVSQPLDVDFAGGDMAISSTIVSLVGANASASVRGFTRNSRGKAGVGRDGSQVINVRSVDFECDISLLAKTAGNQAYNTNAGLTAVSGTSAGLVGPVVCDGTVWHNLASGSTY